VLEHLHVLLNSHFSYSLVDGFCCVLTKLKPPNDSGRKLQHPDFSIQTSASGLRHPGFGIQDPVGDALAGSLDPGVF
jgi:hypothetical protein